MIVIKGIEYRSLEEQVYKNMIDIAEQALEITALNGRVTALEEESPDMSQYVTKATAQQITGQKTFTHPITIDSGGAIVELGNEGISGGIEGGYLSYPPDLLTDPDYEETIATRSDIPECGKIYKHHISMYSEVNGGPPEIVINGTIISSKNTPYTKADFISMGAFKFCDFINDNLIGGLTRLARGSGDGICISLIAQSGSALNMSYIAGMSPDYDFIISYTQTLQLDNTWTLDDYIPEEL